MNVRNELFTLWVAHQCKQFVPPIFRVVRACPDRLKGALATRLPVRSKNVLETLVRAIRPYPKPTLFAVLILASERSERCKPNVRA